MKKRAICSICSLLLAVGMVIGLAPAALAKVPDRPGNKYVLDEARVLSDSTEKRMIAENQELFESCGAEIVVAAVDFLGGEDIDDYTDDMFNSWGVGSEERNNGILLVLAIGEENYYIQAGYGIDDYFDRNTLAKFLNEYLEPDFAAGDYEEGVKKIFNALLDEMNAYYESGPGRDDPMPQPDYEDGYWEEDDGHGGFIGVVSGIVRFIVGAVVLIVVVVVIAVFLSALFGGGGPRGGGGGGGFWRGMFLGSMMNRRRNYWGAPPPPPPPPFGRPPSGPRPGGFGGRPPRPGGFGGFGGSGGFHSGGGSRGGGAGRGFGGGGGFHGGGGSHGGGAGRR